MLNPANQNLKKLSRLIVIGCLSPLVGWIPPNLGFS